jgi:hypothetical protein
MEGGKERGRKKGRRKELSKVTEAKQSKTE